MRILLLTLLIAAGITVAGCGSDARSAPATFSRTTADAVADDIAKGRSLLVDVRETSEWDAGHAPTAIHVPLGTVGDELARITRAADDRPIVFICRSGARSAEAAQVAVDGGLEQVSSVDGGMQAWIAADQPLVLPSPSSD